MFYEVYEIVKGFYFKYCKLHSYQISFYVLFEINTIFDYLLVFPYVVVNCFTINMPIEHIIRCIKDIKVLE